MRAFKLGINSLACLTPHQVKNLAKYMDRRDNGMIHVKELDTAIKNSDMFSPSTISDDYKPPVGRR